MGNTNLGIIKETITKELTESYLSGNNINESKTKFNKFFKIIKESPILQLKFKVFNNLEKNYISESALAIRYIDDNIKLFENYSLDEIISENEKLKDLISENVCKKNSLYNAIETLIIESKKTGIDINPDKLHNSINKVISHLQIKKDKNNMINENVESQDMIVSEDVLKIAIKKFNDRYSDINENDLSLIKKLYISNFDEKKNILEDLKKDNLTILNSLKDDETIKDKIQESIKKIKSMSIDENTINEKIVGLIELKNGLS